MGIKIVKKKFSSKLPESFFPQDLTVEKYKNALHSGQSFFNICNTAVNFS